MTVMIWNLRTAAAVLIVIAATVSACGKKPPEAKPQPPPPAPSTPTTTPTPPPPTRPPDPPPTPERPPTEDEIFAKSTVDDLTKSGVLKPVYFALDSIELTEESRGILQKNTDYLKRRPSTKILVEGHADSRGTNEYNLALANRRADAVRAYLLSLGVAADRMTIVSKGEEQPFCREETEECWAKNRVGYFIFTAK
ncbi:MAG TPA: OmpA family protein [Vicinamibacterales bacterium]|jgi:peptidoglycan-associated lipoprotein